MMDGYLGFGFNSVWSHPLAQKQGIVGKISQAREDNEMSPMLGLLPTRVNLVRYALSMPVCFSDLGKDWMCVSITRNTRALLLSILRIHHHTYMQRHVSWLHCTAISISQLLLVTLQYRVRRVCSRSPQP